MIQHITVSLHEHLMQMIKRSVCLKCVYDLHKINKQNCNSYRKLSTTYLWRKQTNFKKCFISLRFIKTKLYFAKLLNFLFSRIDRFCISFHKIVLFFLFFCYGIHSHSYCPPPSSATLCVICSSYFFAPNHHHCLIDAVLCNLKFNYSKRKLMIFCSRTHENNSFS